MDSNFDPKHCCKTIGTGGWVMDMTVVSIVLHADKGHILVYVAFERTMIDTVD